MTIPMNYKNNDKCEHCNKPDDNPVAEAMKGLATIYRCMADFRCRCDSKEDFEKTFNELSEGAEITKKALERMR